HSHIRHPHSFPTRRSSDLEYVDRPLNTTCAEYAPANRVFAGAYAETHANTDFLIVLDSDTVWLAEPELPHEADAAVRPVDHKGGDRKSTRLNSSHLGISYA